MSGQTTPLISIVIPTRDRPEHIATTLEALRRQTFRDVEFIVSDNAQRRPLQPTPGLFDGTRFRYVRAPHSMWMTDHWEFAVAQARGSYVGVLGDKSTLVSGALERIAAEIANGAPDAISWRLGNFRPSGRELAGPGELAVPRIAPGPNVHVPPSEALEFLLGTYLNAAFQREHQKEIRGSLYHGVYSARLIAAVKARFGRLFHYFAPDLTAQCVAMQTAETLAHIGQTLELVIAGPSNGVAVSAQVSGILGTQEDAARGSSGLPPPLIDGVSVSVSHALACDLVATAGRTLRIDQWEELHRKAARDLYYVGGWPDRAAFLAQRAALFSSADRFGLDLRPQLMREAWKARRAKTRARIGAAVREHLGERVVAMHRALRGGDALMKRRPFDHLFGALDALG